jgi:capsular polysaccharide transport system permease protein
MFLLSGVFYLPATMPPSILAIIEWNPILHCVEMVRSSYYVKYLSVADPYYPISFATITFAIALFLERINRDKLMHT